MCTPGYDVTLDRFMGVAHPLPRRRGDVAFGNHTFVNALPWMCRAGAPRRDPPERHGKWITVCRRFDRRSGNGAMGRLFTALREERIIGVGIRTPAMGSTGVKVRRHAAGAPGKKGGLPVRRHLPGRVGRRSSRGVRRREHGRRDPSKPGRQARHGPWARGGFHPAAGRVVRPDVGHAAQEEPYGPMGSRQGGVQGAEHGRTRPSIA